MIPEAFLISTLAVTPISFAHHPFTNGTVNAYRNFLAGEPFESGEAKHFRWFSIRRLWRQEPKVLIVDGPNFLVPRLRAQGVKAFGIWTDFSDRGPSTPYHAVGLYGAMPIRPSSIHALFWARGGHTNYDIAKAWLNDLALAIEPGGLIAFIRPINPHWRELLANQNWVRIGFDAGGLDLWRKPKKEEPPAPRDILRVLTIGGGQMIAGIKVNQDSPKHFYVYGSSHFLPFKKAVFDLLHIGNILFDSIVARELSRVSKAGAYALARVVPNGRDTYLSQSGWMKTGDRNQWFAVFRKSA